MLLYTGEEEKEEKPPVKKRRHRTARDRTLRALRGRGRPIKIGRPKKKRPNRPPPNKRSGARFFSVTVYEETYLQLKELIRFYKAPSIGKYLEGLVEPAFKQAYIESERLQRIAKNREKANEIQTSDNTDPPRRTHF